MERKGLTLEAVFRSRYNLSDEIDLFALLEESIMVVSWEKPEEFMIKKWNIAERLFRENPRECNFKSMSCNSDTDDDGAAALDKQESTGSSQITSARSDDALTNGKNRLMNKQVGRRIIKLPKKSRKESDRRDGMHKKPDCDRDITVQSNPKSSDGVQKRSDQRMVHRKFEASLHTFNARSRQIQQNRRRTQVIDIKNVPLPATKSIKQSRFRRPLLA